MNAPGPDTEVRKENEVSLAWGYQEIRDPLGHQAHLGSLHKALLALQGPVDLLGHVTRLIVFFLPCKQRVECHVVWYP
ncbi:hypothetical protein CHARACLAT_014544 [Characodon lateralis]|uniref:Uncharacterized protein n=1 Tax=Characodon lateralis TaxID=208331 RepID=A0ABU7D151_9TELE|nr:hypothetical protein [Characodon lateralis]